MTNRKRIVNPCLDSSSYLKEYKSYVNYTSLLKNDLSIRVPLNYKNLNYTPHFEVRNKTPLDIMIGRNLFPIIRQNGRKFWISNKIKY